jgi:RNA polymerase sigma factor (sigma-70 family)
MRRQEADREFEEFARASVGPLVAFGYALTGNQHDAWDLAQEALLRLGRSWRRRDIASPWTYTRVTMVRLNVDRARRASRETLTPDHGEVSSAEPDDVTDLHQWLVDALHELTPGQRAALALKHMDEMTNAEIADAMGCSESTVRTHLSRGAAAIRAAQVGPIDQENHARHR